MAPRENKIPPHKRHFTTGEAATLCSVTADTVLKWIRAGKIPANRTPGGHHRIPQDVLMPLLKGERPIPQTTSEIPPVQYCWEFYSSTGRLRDGCRACVVYRSRTRRCYELSSLPTEAGHSRLFCEGSCEDCDYYRLVREQPPAVLVVTDKNRLKDSLEKESGDMNFKLRTTDCEYRCSMLIDEFRPDYVIIDCSLGTERSREFAQLLYEDPRIPFVKIILAGNRRDLPKECDKLVFAFIKPRFTAMMLADLIAGSAEDPEEANGPQKEGILNPGKSNA